MGISVKDETSHKELGLVADGGSVDLNGIQDDGEINFNAGATNLALFNHPRAAT
ncbi:hypothetical protein ACO2XV_06610 [Escherichia coli]